MTLEAILAARTRESSLCERLDDHRLRCLACGHRCPIPEGRAGVCKVRFNDGGRLMVPWGYTAGVNADPIEKKPFFHVLPGSVAFSFGMLGCDLHCSYCQNWISSQTLRDPDAQVLPRDTTPESLVAAAMRSRADSVISTYNEPLITLEWAVDVFRLAKQHGLLTGFVSNGNATPEALEYLRPHMDLFKVDLKSFDDKQYRKLGGRLAPILESIRRIHEMGFWLEVVTLLVPGFNDDPAELRQMADFIVSVSPFIPWHITAFHPDYKMTDREWTSIESIRRAAAIGKEAGLKYVYAGNLPGADARLEHTWCHQCGALLVERYGLRTLRNRLGADGACPKCGARIPGVWRRPSKPSGSSGTQ